MAATTPIQPLACECEPPYAMDTALKRQKEKEKKKKKKKKIKLGQL